MYNARTNGRVHISPTYSGVDQNAALRAGHRDEQILSLGDLVHIIWRRLWVIVLVPLVLTGLATGFSVSQTPTYQASAKILVGQEPADSATADLNSELQGIQLLTLTIAEAVKTRPVAEGVIQELDLSVSPQTLQENLNAEAVTETQFIEVSFQDPSPERARLIANAVGDVLSERAAELGPSGSGPITATVWEPAVLPDAPVSPDLMRNVFLALVVGLMLGVGLAFLLNYLDDSWRSADEVEQLSGVPTFGVVPEFEVRKKKRNLRSRRQGPSGSHPQE